MSANDLVMQRLTDTLAQLHTEMVLIRQQRNRAHADAFEAVDEFGVNIGTGGTVTIDGTTKSAPVLIKRWFIYCSANTATLQLEPTGFKIPLAAGITTFTMERLYGPEVRPVLSDTSTTSNLYIRLSGHALPSVADAL